MHGGDEQFSATVSAVGKWIFKRTRSRNSVVLCWLPPLVFSFPYLRSSVSRKDLFFAGHLELGLLLELHVHGSDTLAVIRER